MIFAATNNAFGTIIGAIIQHFKDLHEWVMTGKTHEPGILVDALLVILPAFIVTKIVYDLATGKATLFRDTRRPPPNPQPTPTPHPPPPPYPAPHDFFGAEPLLADEYWHGTKTKKAAIDILNTNTWLIGDNTPDDYPKGIYATKDLGYAKNMAGGNGAILKIRIDKEALITDLGQGRLVLEIPTAKQGKYYFPEGITPLAVYNTDMTRIA